MCFTSTLPVCPGEDAGGDASSGPGSDASLAADAPADAAVDHCTGALHVAVGGSVSGNTCGGPTGTTLAICGSGHPDAYVVVDAPAGTSLHLVAPLGFSIAALAACDSTETQQCTFSSGVFDPSDPRYRIFGLERADAPCGAFTLTVSAR
jgi:hypothetical protein